MDPAIVTHATELFDIVLLLVPMFSFHNSWMTLHINTYQGDKGGQTEKRAQPDNFCESGQDGLPFCQDSCWP